MSLTNKLSDKFVATLTARLTLLLCTLLFCCITDFAQEVNSGSLRGKVVEAETSSQSVTEKTVNPLDKKAEAPDPPDTANEKTVGPDNQTIVETPGCDDQTTGTYSRPSLRRRLEPVAFAKVEVRSKSDGKTIFSTLTNLNGEFISPVLAYGNYIVNIKARDYEEGLINVEIFSNDVIDVTIEVNPKPTTQEDLTGGKRPTPVCLRVIRQRRSLIDARRDGAYLARTLTSISLGGASLTRSYDEMAFYIPGIAAPPQTLSNFAGPGFGAGVGTSGQFAANGLRSRANNFTVDGSDNNDEDIGVRRQGFFSLVPQSVESIRQYQVITAVAPAQVGRNLGAQVNAVSQYGTSVTHGSFYGTFSSDLLNASDFFDTTGGNTTIPLTALVNGNQRNVFVDGQQKMVTNKAGRKDRFNFGQVGATIGGPLRQAKNEKDLKIFYFLAGEFQQLKATKEAHFAVPTVEQRGLSGTGATGLSRDPFNNAPLDAFPTASQGDAIFSFFPFPNNPHGVYGRNTFTQELPSDGRGIIFSAHVDAEKQIFRRYNQFIARYNFTDDYRDVPSVGGALFSTIRPHIRAQALSLFANSLLNREDSSTLVSNQFFVSYGQTRFDFEERRDTEFLIPTHADLTNADERSFLLNVPLLQNQTRPGMGFVNYLTSNVTAEARLGTPFELINSPVGQIIIAGFSPVGLDVLTFPQKRTNNTYQIADTLTIQTGKHTFSFGTDIRRSELNSRLPRNSRPLITFNGGVKVIPIGAGPPFEAVGTLSALDLAATGAANGVYQTLTTGDDATIGLRYYQYNFFGRDEWRIRPHLTLSFGLRYEYNTPPREMHRRIEKTFSSPILRAVGLDQFVRARERIFTPDRNNFAPRLGLAYSFGEDDRNIIRLGGGVFYDQVPGVVVSQSRNVVPTFVTFNTAGLYESQEVSPGQFRNIGLGILLPSNLPIGCGNSGRIPVNEPGTLNTINPSATVPCILDTYLLSNNGIFGFQPVLQTVLPAEKLEMPMAYHYTGSFEREVGDDTMISVAYVGTQGRYLLRQTTPNLGDNVQIVVPALIITDGRPRLDGFVGQPVQRDGGGNLVSRLSQFAGTVRLYEASGNSHYDALQLQMRGRFAVKASYQLSYTLSRVTDDVSDVFELAGAPALPQNSLTRAGERSAANFDARHIFSGYFIYNFPELRAANRVKEFLLSNWQITCKARFQTGQPFTVNTLRDVNGDGNLTDRPDTTSGIVVTEDRQQPLLLTVDPLTLLAPDQHDGSVGRNTFRSGSLFDLDVSFLKRFVFEKNGKSGRELTFRIDIFNLTNRANFGIPVRILEAPGFGRAINTITPGRRLQFALKASF